MDKLIEKIKNLDKKVLIGAGITVVVVIILLFVLIIGGKKPNQGNGTESQNTETEQHSAIESEETETANTESVNTDTEMNEIETEATEVGTEDSTEENSTESEKSNQDSEGQNSGDKEASDKNPGNQDSSASENQGGNTTTTPGGQDISGKGSSTDPYTDAPDLDAMTLTTVTIPAGKTVYYGIYRVGNMYMTIEDADAYVITSDGQKHTAKGGKVAFQMENVTPKEYVLIQIGNSSSQDKAFTLKFANLQGSQMNPEQISGNGPFTKHLNAGDETGYYYGFKAEKTGTMRVYMTATATSELKATNNKNGSMDEGTIQRAFNNEEDVKTDENGRSYIELPVTAGHMISIHIQAVKPTRGSIPETDITFEIAYY